MARLSTLIQKLPIPSWLWSVIGAYLAIYFFVVIADSLVAGLLGNYTINWFGALSHLWTIAGQGDFFIIMAVFAYLLLLILWQLTWRWLRFFWLGNLLLLAIPLGSYFGSLFMILIAHVKPNFGSMFAIVIYGKTLGWHNPRFYVPYNFGFIGAFSLVSFLWWYFVYGYQNDALGDSRFAWWLDIQRAGWFVDKGVLVGKKFGKWLVSAGFEHVLCIAPTGGGKTSRLVMPNMFRWLGSMVVNDNKRTLWKLTSKFREKVLGHQCYLWALSWSAKKGVRTFRFNPLTFIANNRLTRIKDLQRLSHIVIPDGKGDPLWFQGSREIFMAVALYLLDQPDKSIPCTLGEMTRIIKRGEELFTKWIAAKLEVDGFDAEFYRNGYSFMGTHVKTRGSIYRTCVGYFELFADPIIDAATSATDFDIRHLRREKMSIYVGFKTNDRIRLSRLLTIFWEQVISAMIDDVPNPKTEPHDVLLVLDEFPTLGKIECIADALSVTREYRIRFMIFVQYLHQTLQKYGKDEAKAFNNIKTKVAMAPDDIDDAEYVSKLLGMKAAKIFSGSSSQSQQGGSDTSSYQRQSVPLMRPEKVMRLKDNRALIMRTRERPIYANITGWYEDKELKDLPCGESAVPIQPLKQVAFERPVIEKDVDEQERKKQEKLEREERQHKRNKEIAAVQAFHFGGILKDILKPELKPRQSKDD